MRIVAAARVKTGLTRADLREGDPEAAGAVFTRGRRQGSQVPAVPARALRASAPLPGASAPHSACAAPSLAVSAAPSLAFVAVGEKQTTMKEISRESRRTVDVTDCPRDACTPEGLSPVLSGDTRVGMGRQQFSIYHTGELPRFICLPRNSRSELPPSWLMGVFKSGVGNTDG